MTQSIILPVSYIQIAIRELSNKGITPEQILDGTGLNTDSLQADDYVSLEQFINVILNTRKLSHNPAIGLLLGSLLHPSTHGPVGWAAINSPTLSDAINIFQRYSQIRTPFILYTTLTQGDEYIIRLTLTDNLKAAHTIFIEAMLMLLQHIIEFILGRPMTEASLYMNSFTPSYADSYQQYFHCPIHFNSGHLEIRLPLSLKNTPNPNADKHMYQIALEQCQGAYHQLQRDINISTEIYDYISANLSCSPTLAHTAIQFSLTPRTLTRRLKDQQTSFQKIKDDVYAFQASSYLRRSAIAIDTLSVIFGYSDPANFRRSFKRWFGQTPQQYRQQHQKH
ncbi:MAG: AraC family transcriptional regulator [Cycloclasticus sp.]|nr:AraC family transcriptional regulator [Cycloclasticus sp.]